MSNYVALAVIAGYFLAHWSGLFSENAMTAIFVIGAGIYVSIKFTEIEHEIFNLRRDLKLAEMEIERLKRS